MSPPQNILDALNAVQDDADALALASMTNDQKQAALIQAQSEAAGAMAAVESAAAHEATDLAALHVLLNATYGP